MITFTVIDLLFQGHSALQSAVSSLDGDGEASQDGQDKEG